MVCSHQSECHLLFLLNGTHDADPLKTFKGSFQSNHIEALSQVTQLLRISSNVQSCSSTMQLNYCIIVFIAEYF